MRLANTVEQLQYRVKQLNMLKNHCKKQLEFTQAILSDEKLESFDKLATIYVKLKSLQDLIDMTTS